MPCPPQAPRTVLWLMVLFDTVPPLPEAHTVDSTCCSHIPEIVQLAPVVSAAPPPPSAVFRSCAFVSMWKVARWQEVHWNTAPNPELLGCATDRYISLYQ